MTDSLRDHLQSSLGSAYTLERELGGGGMSRVFAAHDEPLGREVVVKVLSPDLAHGVSAKRFAREIRLAAALQEPHIVPVLGNPMLCAMIYARFGMADSVFSRLALAIERRDDSFAHSITFTEFAPYKSDPRWDRIVGAVQRR